MFKLLLTDFYQTITIEASDGEKYDFYINEGLICENTNKCTFKHDLDQRCDLMLVSARRDSVIFGRKEYGYKEKSFMLSIFDRDDNKDEYKKCPESFSGAKVVVPISDIVRVREKALQRKKNAARWNEDPFNSSIKN